MKEKGWVITGGYDKVRFIYNGWWSTRRDAIYFHSRDLGLTWNECRKYGDRCVKATIAVIK